MMNLNANELTDLLLSNGYKDVVINASEFSGMRADSTCVYASRFKDGLYGNPNARCWIKVNYRLDSGKLKIVANF